MIKKNVIKIAEKIIQWIQKYCSLIVPNDEHTEGYSMINRSRAVILVVSFVMLMLVCRLFFILLCDTYKHKRFFGKKVNQFKRLEITDRNGKVLVNSIEIYDLYLMPSKIFNLKANIKKINKVIPNAIKDEKAMYEKLLEKQDTNKTVFIKSGITIQQRHALLDEDVEGMFFENSEKRFYINSSTNSITGYCPSINNCVSGIEKSMNSYLNTMENEPLKLSIDITAQNILSEILKQRLIETNSQGAVGIIMKIKTGEIISAVSIPDCDYNNYSTCDSSALFNRYSYGVYEIGSVMKLITTALALQSGISPYKEYKREAYKIDDNFTIHDIDKKDEKGGYINLIDMVKISSNVGFAKLMEDIKINDQISFISNLGMLQKLQIELPESGKPIFPKRWTATNALTISYGHGIAITPLHYVSALASLLKNSIVRPTFLETNDEDKYDYKYLDDDKYEIFKDIMRQVVNSGGGRSAYIDEYDIGGKTGTAMQPENGKYNRYSMVLSFVSAVPMNNPQYIFFLMLDRPKTDARNNNINRASNLLGKTMKYVVSTIGPILNLKPIGK